MSRQRVRVNEGDARESDGLSVWDERGNGHYLTSGERFLIKSRKRRDNTIVLELLTLEGVQYFAWQTWVRLNSHAL